MSAPHTPRPTHLLLPVPFGATAAPGIALQAGDLWLAGVLIVESTGAATATVQLIDGADANGVPITPLVVLAANASLPMQFGGHLLAIRTGLFVRVTAGSAAGVAFLADR